jgi:Lipoprotein LpqB beta-propeller domain/Sporulation and spore germination
MTKRNGGRGARARSAVTRSMVMVAASLTLLALFGGCVAVPTTGPVRKVEGQQPTCQNCVNVEVAAPAPGADPRQIVEDYLRATSNYQPNYSVAKQFLTKAALEKWSPEDGAIIFQGTPTASGNSVILNAQLIGTLDPNRSYTAQDRRRVFDFGLTKEDGQWRIGKPPRGLMITESAFTRFYSSYSLYFISNGHLVPDPIYLPNLRSSANIASVLMKALLAGPSVWLKPAVTTAIPPNTALSGDAVTITDGIATVPLNDPVLQLDEQQRALMAAQMMYTLQKAVGVRGVLFTVNQQPLRVAGGDDVSFVLPADAVPRELDPIPFVAGDQLYAVRNGGVKLLSTGTASPEVRSVDGDLGKVRSVDSLAVSFANTDLAVVSENRTVLRWSPTASGRVHPLLSGQQNLLRPQFSRYGELWVIGGRAGKQQMRVFRGDKRVVDTTGTDLLSKGEITAFRVSPDGARMAVIRKIGGRTELGLARINRAEKITVDGWRLLDTTQTEPPQLVRLRDVAWIDATELLVLGASGAVAPPQTYRISQDASTITADGESTSSDAKELTVLLPTQTAIVVGASGQSYRNDTGQWSAFVGDVSTIAYPG